MIKVALLTVIIVALAMFLMSLGLILRGRTFQATCGGKRDRADEAGACPTCGRTATDPPCDDHPA